MPAELKFAVLIDYDNIAIGVKNSLSKSFDYSIVSKWLRRRGEVLAQIAYGNWSTHSDFRIVSKALTKQGVQMEHLETASSGSKNGADIALSIDAVELVFTQKHIDAFCILSGDSDFLPLVHKLKKHNKRVYVVAGNSFASDNLRRNCHEFVSYEQLCGRAPPRNASYPVSAPMRGRVRAEPVENAFPAVRRALRAMERRGETSYINQLGTYVNRIEPDFDERAYGCETFKDLIIELVNAGYLWRKTIRGNRFCIAESDSPPRESSMAPRLRRSGGHRRGLSGGRSAGERDVRPDRSPARLMRGRVQDSQAVRVIKQAVSRIERSGRLADLDLLYKTILEIDPQFRAYGSSEMEFRGLVGALGRKGHFRIRTSSGAYVVELHHAADSVDAERTGRLGRDARQVLSEILKDNDSMLRAGLPNKQLGLIIETHPQFDANQLGLQGPEHLLELAVREGLLNARRDASGVVRCFPPDAGEEMVRALESAAKTGPSRFELPSETDALEPPKGPRAKPRLRTNRAASGESRVEDDPSGTESVDRAVEIVCDAVRMDGRVFDPGLRRSDFRSALEKAEPDFDLKTYGILTFRVLLDQLRDKGYLEAREEADGGVRFVGTEQLARFGDRSVKGSQGNKKGIFGWWRQ